MEQLKHMKECLMSQAQSQMAHLDKVDAKELGEVIDMIKDLEEAIYYCTITKAMKENEEDKEKGKEVHYYPIPPQWEPPIYYYSSGNGNSSNSNSNSSRGGNSGGRRSYFEGGYEYPMDLRDAREGRSPKTRKMYMESKEMRHDKALQMQGLEQYMKELSTDVVEMIQGASPEEKQLLKSKLTTLVSKIDHA